MRAAPERVDVWHVDLDASMPDAALVVSEDERTRANRFATPGLAQRFLAGRAALRRVLAGCVGIEPSALVFATGPHGKPVVDRPAIAVSLSFNVSHSGRRFVCAVTTGRRVGIDIECARGDVDPVALARRYFAPEELAALMAVPPPDRPRAFLSCWTRKEAFIKAVGLGLSMPLARFAVSFGPGTAPALLRVDGDPDAARRWSLASFEPGPDCVGAVVVEGSGWTLEHRRLTAA